jgi:dienelactone hydrolase
LLLATAGCGGGSGGDAGGGQATPPPPPPETCTETSDLVDGICQPFAIREDARATTTFVEDGQPVTLEVVLFRPLGDGPYPTVVFHHGSTGNGSDPSRFGLTFTSKPVTRFFTQRGWMVAFPQRRGRGRSDGLYDEGFTPDRRSYSCEATAALAGAERAMDDIDAATEWLRMRADVDTRRMLIGGTSRGGILSVAFVARRPEVYLGAVNFVGGWIEQGCGDHRVINRRLFEAGAEFPGPSLWLYGTNDAFYGLDYSRNNFQAFVSAGGFGTFHGFTRAPGLNGHFLINDPALWAPAMENFLASL